MTPRILPPSTLADIRANALDGEDSTPSVVLGLLAHIEAQQAILDAERDLERARKPVEFYDSSAVSIDLPEPREYR